MDYGRPGHEAPCSAAHVLPPGWDPRRISQSWCRVDPGGCLAVVGPGGRGLGLAAQMLSWNDDRTQLSIGRSDRCTTTYDVKGIADRLAIRVDSLCWGWAFSTGTELQSLDMCECFGAPGHEGLRSAAHVLPAGWDAAMKVKAFRRRVPSIRTQLRQAASQPPRANVDAGSPPGAEDASFSPPSKRTRGYAFRGSLRLVAGDLGLAQDTRTDGACLPCFPPPGPGARARRRLRESITTRSGDPGNASPAR